MCRPRFLFSFVVLAISVASTALLAGDGNRLAYLDRGLDPYYVGVDFPKLTTPQWIGEEGVEAVVVFAIDDMREVDKYEQYLRPILERLKKIDGRAPISIMTNRIDPNHPHLQKWLKEGLSIDVHTYDHPCPCLQGGDFGKARLTYDQCVDLMAEIPGNRPVAFRMPCCDSLNTPSPRFWAEIFNRTTKKGNFLSLDSSVFQIFTSADKQLPREITLNEKGEQRFKHYVPFESFVNTIENYPYPYLIGGRCWEFPCIVPSDWEAQHVQQPNNPDTVRDMKLALDAVVLKKGVFNLVFHPHGWIRNDQVVELIDHAVAKHGKKIKFLSFREAADRLNKHLLAGQQIRSADGGDGGVRLIDLHNDGYLDVLIGNEHLQQTRIWSPEKQAWTDSKFPLQIARQGVSQGVVFGVLEANGSVAALTRGAQTGAWVFANGRWNKDSSLLAGLEIGGKPLLTSKEGRDQGVRLRDLDDDGVVELLVANAEQRGVFRRDSKSQRWQKLPFSFPEGVKFVDSEGRDAGLRMVDINKDGCDDLLFSDESRYSLHLFDSIESGWSIRALSSKRAEGGDVPMIVRNGTNNGVWFHSDHLWVQNEDTNRLPNLVDRRSYDQLLAKHRGRQKKAKLPPTKVGIAKIDITPSYAIRLSGYGSRKTESEGVAQKIWAKAIAIGADRKDSQKESEGPAVLLSVENCSITTAITTEVAQRLKEKTGLERQQLAICSTHTHTAPVLVDSLGFLFPEPIPPEHQKNIERYTRELTDKLVQVALDALANRQDAKLWRGEGKVGFAVNRRVLKDGRWTGFGVQADGPVDHSLPILVAKDMQGKTIAVLFNYACHCTTLGGDFNQINGDWAGYAQEYIELENPGAIAIATIGCGADANPEPRGGGLDLCQQHGRSLANEVGRLLKSELAPVDPQLKCRLLNIELPLDPAPTLEQWQERAKERGQVGRHASFFLAKLKNGEKIATSVPYPVATWSFGDDLAMVFLGGEVVVDYAIRLKTEFDAEKLWINAYANDVPCYIPSKRILREGGYESERSMIYYGKPSRLADDTEDLIVDSVQKLLSPRFYSAAKQVDFPPPTPADQAVATMKVRPGMKIELVASEPLIVDPVAFDWGPDGRLWVVEMRDYPNGMDNKGSPGGRIKVLTDTDGDGRYDRSVLFLDNISFPSGVKVWRKGILVTAAPDIFYAEDTDGDGKADLRETLYHGFGEGNQQHRVNGLRWGLDNWLYVGNGDSAGSIRSLKTKDKVSISGRDLRISPDDGLLDPQSGSTQFGRSQDDWGNWFGGNNSNPMWHYLLDDRYLRRNGHFAPPTVRRQISVQPGPAPVFPASRTLARFNDFDRVNRFTSACSPIIYRDNLLGEDFAGNSFVCEPVHNLLHREVVQASGFSFTSRRASDEQNSEFLASSDNWSRFSMTRTGPDGALWVADMYRFVIEHPTWVPASWQRKLDLRAGETKGRIYRIFPADKSPRPMVKLDELDTAGLVAALDSANGWQRDMAQQMLLWREDRAAIEPLKAMAASCPRPQARLHALCTLDGLDALTEKNLLLAIRDEHPGVRRHGIRLSEPMLSDHTSLQQALLGLRDEEDPFVLQQLAYSLGQWKSPQTGPALARLALRFQNDSTMTAAILSSAREDNISPLLEGVMRAMENQAVSDSLVEQLLSVGAAYGQKESIKNAITIILKPTNNDRQDFTTVGRVLDLLQRRNRKSEEFLTSETKKQISQIFLRAQRSAANPKTDEAVRLLAIRLIGRSNEQQKESLQLLAELLSPQNSSAIQAEAVATIARLRSKNAPEMLLADWPSHTPSLRTRILDALLSRSDWTEELLSSIEKGDVLAAHIDARRRQQLLQHRQESIRQKASKLLVSSLDSNRLKVIQEYQDVISMSGDLARGKKVFEKRCSVCHRLDGVGRDVGPNLIALTDKSPQAMLIALLDPNRALEDKFLDYIAITNDGRQFSGVLTNETSNSITLTGPEGKQQVVLRSDIDELHSTGKSLMPEGLEKDISKQEMADVFAYLRKTGPPPKSFSGNTPQIAPVRDDGSIRLFAIHSRIYGPTLVFEEKYRNLGFWQSPEDRAVWSMEVPRAGTYRVSMNYAVPDSAAGDSFIITAAGQTLGGRVESSGSWDNYRSQSIGEITLPAGPVELVFRSAGPIRSAMIDLRTIYLIPVKPKK